MKKGLIKRLVYAGLIVLVSITSAAGEKNLLSNPGFEKGRDGWSGQWDKECFLDNSQSHNGSSSIKIVCPEGRHHVSVSQTIKQVKPRTNYVLGGWSKAGKSPESRQFKSSSYLVLFYNEENKLIGNSGGGRIQWLPPWVEAYHPWTHSSYVFNTPPDTARIMVCCSLTRAGALWFDDIYLQEVSEGEVYNILPNSSFEVTTNPDTPDYWGRDLNNPPFGEEVWAIDTATAYHGKKSLRIGVKDKYARRIHGIKVAQGKDYIFSVYIKSNQEGTKVCLELTGAERSEKKKEVTVTKDWQRYAMTAKMKDTGTVVYVRLLSDAVVWLDALQLEKGTTPRPYGPSLEDIKSTIKPEESTGTTRKKEPAASPASVTSRVLDLVGTEFDFYTDEEEARVRCFVEGGIERLKNFKLYWWVEKSGEPGLFSRRSVSPLKPGINTWTVPLAKLADGTYLLRVELYEKGKQIAASTKNFRKLPPARHEVRINQWGRFLVCNGRPFFWYGFFCTLSEDDERTIEILKDIKSVNSTAVLNYVGRSVGIHKNIGKVLDRAHALGLKMWVHLQPMTHYGHPVPRRRFGYTAEEKAMADLTEVVTKNRDHPALLGWCTLDEPGDKFNKEYVEPLYQFIKELDPYHPVIYSHLNVLFNSEIYSKTTDIAIIPFNAKRHEHLFQVFWRLGLPLATNSPCYSGGINIHDPTPSQQRAQMYKSLIFSSRGLCTYTYRCTSMHTWREFGRIGKELQVLSPILLTPDDRLRVTARPHDVFAMLKAYKRKYYLIAVNMAEEEVEAEFQLHDLPRIGTVKPMFSSPAARVESRTKKLTVVMKGQSTGVYKIKISRRTP